jgi:hypothetical protein
LHDGEYPAAITLCRRRAVLGLLRRKLAHEDAGAAESTFKPGLDKRIARVKLLVIW